ncbi:recombinase family protein [Polaromonas sp.]|uniref:recombinase family protein n=1 Tax=Polaromonas sp. TaxID=1869339 RepID=UPI003525F87E
MKRAIIYARVSSKRQADDGLPIESQLDRCRVKAEALGAEVLKEFVDGGISGTTDKRPAFQEAINYCSLMDVDYFITWSSSRFARNVLDAGRYKLVLQTYRTRLTYVSSDVDVSTDDGWLMDGFFALFDEHVSRRVSSDTRRSMLKAAGDGYFMGGRVPFGYAAIPDGKRRRLVEHPGEAETVRRVYDLSLQGHGVKIIAMTLNDAGLFLRGRRWAKNTVNFMLTSEVYCGVSIFNRLTKRKPNPPDLWVRVSSHPAIIDAETFGKVQQSLQARRPERVGGIPRSQAVFAGLLRCGHCEGALTLTNGTARDGTRHHYYGCCTHMRGKEKCNFKNIRVDSMDPWLVSELLDKVLTPETVIKVVKDATAMGGQWARDRQLRRDALVRGLREAEGKRGKLYSVLELLGENAPNLADLGPRLRELNAQIKDLEQSLIKLEDEPTGPLDAPELDVMEVSGMLRGLVEQCQDVKKLRTFLGSFIEKATVTGDTVAVEYNEGRMMSLGGSAVRFVNKWLLNLGSNQGPTD